MIDPVRGSRASRRACVALDLQGHEPIGREGEKFEHQIYLAPLHDQRIKAILSSVIVSRCRFSSQPNPHRRPALATPGGALR